MTLKNTIYADYQATTPVDPRVLEKMLPFWGDSFGNPHSNDHIVGWRAAEAVRESLTSVAALIGADPDEISFHLRGHGGQQSSVVRLGAAGAGFAAEDSGQRH